MRTGPGRPATRLCSRTWGLRGGLPTPSPSRVWEHQAAPRRRGTQPGRGRAGADLLLKLLSLVHWAGGFWKPHNFTLTPKAGTQERAAHLYGWPRSLRVGHGRGRADWGTGPWVFGGSDSCQPAGGAHWQPGPWGLHLLPGLQGHLPVGSTTRGDGLVQQLSTGFEAPMSGPVLRTLPGQQGLEGQLPVHPGDHGSCSNFH